MRTPQKKLTSLIAICMAVTLAGLTLDVYADQLSQDQVETIRSQYFIKNGVPSVNLHNTKPVFSDGAKGYVRYRLGEDGWGSFAPFANASDKGLHTRYCISDAAVLAKNVSSKAYISTAKDTLVTVSDFVVLDVLKEDSQGLAKVGGNLKVVRLGGEVTDQGEKLRVMVGGRTDYSPGKEYLLFLNGKPNTASMPFHASDYVTLNVLHNRVYPSDKAWLGFNMGDTYDSIKSRIKNLSAEFECHQ